jgi:nicotinamide mononucleotide adenylyltransferase
MNRLVQEIIKDLLPEEKKQITALYAGGFKPPTSGHFEVVETALKQNPEIDEFIIFIGSKERNGISQEESLLIWEVYNKYLPFKVKIEPSSAPPVKAVYDFAKNHPTRKILWIIGAREGNEDDFKDLSSRTRSITNYPNIEVRTIITKGGVSGTAARNAAKVSFEKFEPFLPSVLTPEEKQEVYQTVSGKIQENVSYSQHIDIKQKIKELIKHMLQKGMNITPLPKIVFKHGDTKNAKEFLGKTAYYNPETMEIVLYTEGRHPKDIVRSFSHEMVHHTQNLEGRLGNVSTTNTLEDDHLDKLEQEANLNGTMTFRNWTDSLNENILPQEKFAQETNQNWIETSLNRLPGGDKYDLKNYDVTILPLDKIKPTQFGKDYINASSKYQAEQYKKYIMGEINIEDLRREDFFPIVVDADTMDILDGNHRHAVHKMLGIPKIKAILVTKKTLDEAIVKDKVICDNCGWSWDLKDGGEKPYLCHKCGHDNTPLQEKKSKDPFGLNAYAMELGRLREEKTEYTIYCDMDGVLVDFDLGYQELTGITSQQADANGVEAFWSPLSKAGAKFWITLKWMSDGKQLWSYIKKYNPILLSAPSREESSRLGKRVWVKRELPDVKLILKSASQKQQYASPTSILIDDRQKNIDQWNAAGGVGILHTNTANTIKQLKQLGL